MIKPKKGFGMGVNTGMQEAAVRVNVCVMRAADRRRK